MLSFSIHYIKYLEIGNIQPEDKEKPSQGHGNHLESFLAHVNTALNDRSPDLAPHVMGKNAVEPDEDREYQQGGVNSVLDYP
jgi:hypothetical protein